MNYNYYIKYKALIIQLNKAQIEESIAQINNKNSTNFNKPLIFVII